MKTSLEHLPEDKRQDLEIITEVIRSSVKPEMIILFGSFARGNWVDDTYKEDGTTYRYQSDYDILVVTKDPKDVPHSIGKKMREKIRRADWLMTPITLIFHDIKYLNEELEDGSYFFVDILKEGVMLYDTGRYQLSLPKNLSNQRRYEKARLYFGVWFISAGEFLIDCYNALNRGSYAKAMFELHQAAERYYYTVCLVFTDYRPKTHHLAELDQRARSADVRFKTVFPGKTDKEKQLFILLIKAYIDSRYKIGYSVSIENLQWLIGRVELLKELTEQVCGERIEKLRQAAEEERRGSKS